MVVVKLQTGKKIELSDEEYQELLVYFVDKSCPKYCRKRQYLPTNNTADLCEWVGNYMLL